MTFTADMYRVDGSGDVVSTGAGAYGVFDVYAAFDSSDIRMMNIYNASISLSTGDFVHNDGGGTVHEGVGRWANFYSELNSPELGLVPGADSFVAIGHGAFTASTDPDFSDTGSASDAGSIQVGAGWYAPDSSTGNVDSNNQVFLGRFVIADGGGAASVTLSFGGSSFVKSQSTGDTFPVYGTQDFTMPAAGSTVVPNAGGVAVLMGMGMIGRRRLR